MMPIWLMGLLSGRGLKISALILFGGAVAFAGWKANDWRTDAARLRTELAAAESRLANAQIAMRAAQSASEDYQNELEIIRSRPVSTSPVRLCVNPRVPARGRAQPGSDAGSAPAGVVSSGDGPNLEEGPDIGPELRALARKADEVSARLRAHQELTRR